MPSAQFLQCSSHLFGQSGFQTPKSASRIPVCLIGIHTVKVYDSARQHNSVSAMLPARFFLIAKGAAVCADTMAALVHELASAYLRGWGGCVGQIAVLWSLGQVVCGLAGMGIASPMGMVAMFFLALLLTAGLPSKNI